MLLHFCAGHANFGDLLYPLVAKHFIGNDDEYTPIAFVPGPAPLHAGYDFASAKNRLMSHGIKACIVGGGAILRSNWESSAESYRSALPWLRYKSKLSSLLFRDASFARVFRAEYMPDFSAGPFIPNAITDGKIPFGVFSAGAGYTFHKDPEPICRSLSAARIVYTREQSVADAFTAFAPQVNVLAAPDAAILIKDVVSVDGAVLPEEFQSMIATGEKYVVFQSFPQVGSEQKIVRFLRQLSALTRYKVVLLPIGICHDDHKFLASIFKSLPGSILFDTRSVFEILRVIKHSELFVGTSLHGGVTAFSYGRPFLFAPCGQPKLNAFLDIVRLPAERALVSWDISDLQSGDLDWNECLDDKLFEAKAMARAAINRVLQAIRS